MRALSDCVLLTDVGVLLLERECVHKAMSLVVEQRRECMREWILAQQLTRTTDALA